MEYKNLMIEINKAINQADDFNDRPYPMLIATENEFIVIDESQYNQIGYDKKYRRLDA